MSDDQIHYLTPQSLTNLKKELEELSDKKIPEIAKRIDDAKQQGDLSENAEYHQAREDMSWAQGRLIELEKIIQNSKVIDKPSSKNSVTVGSTVVIKVSGKNKEYTIVGPQEANPLKGYISNESPLGEALIGHEQGDKVHVDTPAGKQTYEIVEIK